MSCNVKCEKFLLLVCFLNSSSTKIMVEVHQTGFALFLLGRTEMVSIRVCHLPDKEQSIYLETLTEGL